METMVTIGKKLESCVIPTPQNLEFEVHFSLENSLLSDLSETVAQFVVRSSTQPDLPEKATVKSTLEEYFRVLLYLRIEYVRGNRVPLSPTVERYVIPEFLSIVLEQVGIVDAGPEYGFTLMPASMKDPFEEIGVSTMDEKISWLRERELLIRRWFDFAKLRYVRVLPRSRDGSLDLMAMQVVQETVFSHRVVANPVYALCAAVLGLHQKLGVFMTSIDYGSFRVLRQALVNVVDD